MILLVSKQTSQTTPDPPDNWPDYFLWASKQAGYDTSSRGWTAQLARAIGVGDGTVSRWKDAKAIPDIDSCRKLAVAWRQDVLEVFIAAGHLTRQEAHRARPRRPAPPEPPSSTSQVATPATFGRWLTEARIRAGLWTSVDLGQETGIDGDLIYAWEQGEGGPDILQVFALAAALGVHELTVAAQAGHVNPTAAGVQELMDDPDVPAEQKQAVEWVVERARERRQAG